MHLPEELHPAPERSDPAAPIHFVDCFCGLGGAAQGARDAGLDVALGVDSNEKRNLACLYILDLAPRANTWQRGVRACVGS